MRLPDHNLSRFLRRVRWRLIVTRALEKAGLGVAVASAFACILAGIALVQGRDAMPLVFPAVAVGAGVGLVWGLARRTTMFDAAVEADAQLRLSDLLATACAARRATDDWQLAIVAIADERCRALSPSEVVVHRFGGRAWGGIGLAAAMGLTLGLLSTVPRETRARAAKVAGENVAPETAGEQAAITQRADFAPRPTASAQPESREPIVGGSSAPADATATPKDAPAGRPGNEAGDGSRSSETPASDGATPRPQTGGSSAAGDEAAGGGAGSALIPPGGPAGSVGVGTGRDAQASQRTPPWESASWDEAHDAAGAAVREGKVPDAYRDVVSEYFRGE